MVRLGLATRMILAIAVVISAVAAVSFYLQSEILEESFSQKEIDRANSPRLLIQAEIADEIERARALARVLQVNSDLKAAAAFGESPEATAQFKRVRYSGGNGQLHGCIHQNTGNCQAGRSNLTA